jgi:ATP-dependent DNA ligase
MEWKSRFTRMVYLLKYNIFIKLFKYRWMSEKLDGVRAYWNGQKLISRHSKEILCPNWFTQELNKISLDGELC